MPDFCLAAYACAGVSFLGGASSEDDDSSTAGFFAGAAFGLVVGAGELGFFSPHSWWPLFVCLAVALSAVGLVIGWWLFLIGVFAIVMSMIGFVFEYYRGNFSH